MKICYRCGSNVKPVTVIKEGINLHCLQCSKCGEEYFTSSELVKFDILTGKRKLVRKFGTLGESVIMRISYQILREYKIKPGDYGVFMEKPDGIFIKPI